MTRKFPLFFSPLPWAALMGLAAFVFYTGGTIVWPTYTEWLMRGDFGQHFLGWNFFRHTPLWQFPLGANPAYGETLGSSIVFTDSTPLFAFLFKPFTAWLPQPFQYIGIWLMLSAMLQGIFACKLLSLFSRDRCVVLLATAFFVLAPPFWWRMLLECDALSAHWMILAALYLYFRDRSGWRGWLLLLCLATLTHAYLLAMVLAIWAADMLQRWLKDQASLRTLAGRTAVSAACLALLMWVSGYFMVGGSLATPYGSYFRMSLLALFDPLHWWSRILPDLPRSGGEYEGFNYLGSGMLLLAVLALLLLVRSKGRATLHWHWATLLPLLAAALVLALQALSNSIGWAEHDLLVYRLPDVLQRLADVFRVSSRMFWPMFYLIYIGVFHIAFNLIGKRWLPFLLAALLALQLWDSNSAAQNIRSNIGGYRWQSPLQSVFWKQLPASYRRIAVVMPSAYSFDYFPLTLYASEHGLPINSGYFARWDKNALLALQRQTAEMVASGSYDPHTLYVFYNDPLSLAFWEQAKASAGAADLVTRLDGLGVLAPGWMQCGACRSLYLPAAPAVPAAAPAYTLGQALEFRDGGNAGPYLAGGWATPESWGTWSKDNQAAMRLQLAAPITGDLTLTVSGHSFVPPRYPNQTVKVSVNGQAIGELRYSAERNESVQELRIPAALALKNHGELLILFTVAEPVSPIQAMQSKDVRALGLGAVSMTIAGGRQ
ncbi:hypothetical protein BCF11_1928 [Collimonas sp. PA-H2]|uniref:DUF6311 domain-containing protein n=1 Tax=Collimonas sp. PA-H2 TaxID=1881062 RepID=UPI000C013E28|nr:DUF6311 domain-containing protein [Collimonas sp. PA-H2]PFH09531.1 hypothetical protein BCF11_1928 [Collimonas sp. PA-H2]